MTEDGEVPVVVVAALSSPFSGSAMPPTSIPSHESQGSPSALPPSSSSSVSCLCKCARMADEWGG